VSTSHIRRAKEILKASVGSVSFWRRECLDEWNWRFHASLYEVAEWESSVTIIKNLHDQADRYARMQLSLTRGPVQLLREHSQLVALSAV